MGALTLKPKSGILIDGHKYKDGANVLRKSKVKAAVVDGKPDRGVKLAVRIASDQEVVELKIDRSEIHGLQRDVNSENELETNDGVGGERWRAWHVPRALLPGNLGNFRTIFRLRRPKAIQTVKWAVVYEDQTFTGGFVIFGHADVGWNGAEEQGATVKRRPKSRKKPRPKKRRR